MNATAANHKLSLNVRHISLEDGVELGLNKKHGGRVLLLQGPVGPFFAELNKAMSAAGYVVRQVVFNAGDQMFALWNDHVRFTGTSQEWETWLRFEITQNMPDAIVLFGSSRPAHEIARRVAACLGVLVLSLEEGYLRSGYVSCEVGGNNLHSPLSRWTPSEPLRMAREAVPATGGLRFSFMAMSVWAGAYYLVRDLFSMKTDDPLFHRRRERAVPLAWRWSGYIFRQAIARLVEMPTRISLHRNPGYMLVPLQVASDSQLRNAARGWNTSRLIDASLVALLKAGQEQRIVFKLHPLEPGNTAIARLICQRAKSLGVDRRRLTILHSGRLGDLTAHASGMVVINSTSAFSALHRNIPVLVLGEAVFRHKEVVTIGETEADVAAFFRLRRGKARALIDEFMAELKSQSLVPGDFYVLRGRKIAIDGIIRKLEQLQCALRPHREVEA